MPREPLSGVARLLYRPGGPPGACLGWGLGPWADLPSARRDGRVILQGPSQSPSQDLSLHLCRGLGPLPGAWQAGSRGTEMVCNQNAIFCRK